MTDTRFAPGASTAYVTDDVIAMTPSADTDVLTLCATNTDWSDLVSAFAGRSDTAVVMCDGDALRVAVVGDVAVEVESADGCRTYEGGVEWTTHEAEGACHVMIRSVAADDDELWHCLDVGIVPASVVSRRLLAPSADTVDPFEALFGQTIARSVESAAVRPDDIDGAGRQEPLGVLVFSTGERVVVDRPMVLGRNPRSIDDEGTEHPVRRVKVASPGVSRRHAMIRIDRWQASIDDLGSSNGTRITLPGRPVKPLQPGQPVDLVPGAVVDLGGDVTFAVEEVA